MAQVTILGAKGGPAVRQGGAMPTSVLVRMGPTQIVVDCGLGVTRALVQQGVDLRQLAHIVITHLHSDHVLELGPLIHTAWTTGLKTSVQVWGPPGLAAYWEGFVTSMAFDCALRMPHPPVPDCFALRFDADGKSLCLSSDTAYFPPLASFAQGANVLVHEAMLPLGIEPIIAKTGMGDKLRAHLANSHSTAEQAAQIAKAAGVGHLVFYHLIPADDPAFGLPDWQAAIAGHWNGLFTLAHDGLTVSF